MSAGRCRCRCRIPCYEHEKGAPGAPYWPSRRFNSGVRTSLVDEYNGSNDCKGMKIWHAIFLVLALVSVAQSVHHYPRLPETLASNFGGAGEPGGWMGKRAFFTVYLGLVSGLFLTFQLSGWCLRFIPPRFMNLPNKDRWLSPTLSAVMNLTREILSETYQN